MALRELSVVEQREAFVQLASASGANRSELCRDFGISRKTGYKWLERYRSAEDGSLVDRPRRPHTSPLRTDEATEAAVLRVRAASNNAWGGRKIAWTLASQGWHPVPALSTITEILRRHGKLDRPAQHPGPHLRFERAEPNELWQMDFKGHFPLAAGRCHPLTVLDDHSRYSLGIEACDNEQDGTVRHFSSYHGPPRPGSIPVLALMAQPPTGPLSRPPSRGTCPPPGARGTGVNGWLPAGRPGSTSLQRKLLVERNEGYSGSFGYRPSLGS